MILGVWVYGARSGSILEGGALALWKAFEVKAAWTWSWLD
jgi:hypothetical protein